MQYLLEDWTPMAAYGLSCTVVCQISSAILKINDFSSKDEDDDDTTKGIKGQGNPKKKKKNKAIGQKEE